MKKFMEIKVAVSGSIRILMHDALFIVCAALSIGMFIQFGNSWWTKALMGLVALVFESTKLYDLLKAKKAHKNKNKAGLAFNSVSYTVKALLSVVASVGFALVLLAAQREVAEVSQNTLVLEVENFDENVIYWKGEMDKVQVELDALTEAVNKADGNYGTSITKISENKPALVANKEKYYENWQKAKSEKTAYQLSLQNGEKEIATNPADMFNELTDFINAIKGEEAITSQILMTLIFIAIMLILEISVATTSGELPEMPVIKETEADVQLETADETYGEYYAKFIDAMFDGITGDKVNSVNSIMETTGFSGTTVWKIRQSLLTMSFRGKKILISSKGKTQAGMGKDNMKKVVSFLLKNPTDDILIPELP